MTGEQVSMSALALERVDRAVLLRGQALVDCAVLAAAGIRAAYRDDGIAASPRLRRLVDTLAATARAEMAERGHADVRVEPVPASSLVDEITTTETAMILGLSVRQARRLVPLLGGRRTAAGWLVHRGAVAAHRHERSSA